LISCYEWNILIEFLSYIKAILKLNKKFNEDIGCYLEDSSQNISKIGKTTNDLVNNLWNKTGYEYSLYGNFLHENKLTNILNSKDRYMQKATYMEYLPQSFDSKTILRDTLKSAQSSYPTLNDTTYTNSRQTSAGISLVSDEIQNSDDEIENLRSK